MREIDVIATQNGIHHVEFGMNANELSSFEVKYYITHFKERAIDWIQNLSLGFCTFMGGDLWLHNSKNVPRANLFGEQKSIEVGRS